MRKLSLIFVTLSLLVIAGGAVGYAQVTDLIEVNIPFSFTVGDTTLPAGKYILKSLDIPEGAMTIRTADGHRGRVFLTGEAQIAAWPKQSELIFNRIGDRYFLSEIFEKGNNVGAEVQKSRAEKRLEKQGAVVEIRTLSLPTQEEVKAGS